ncbi:MAG: hypothetical protein AB7V14_03185 [Kiritimatiellia bacterium]
MSKEACYSPVVLYNEEIRLVINALRTSGHESLASMINAKARRSKNDVRYVAALPSLGDFDFDVDDEPVVSSGEGGAYVMVWRWVSDDQAGVRFLKDRPSSKIS